MSAPLPTLPPGGSADIALLLEGTYPFVSGGVSSWVHQLVSHFSEYTFALAFIGASRQACTTPRYTLPPNVVHVECLFLEEREQAPRPRRCPGSAEAFAHSARLHACLRQPGAVLEPELLAPVAQALGVPGELPLEAFLHGERAWEQIREGAAQRYPHVPFVDYFWTVRTMHAPLFALSRLAESLPRVRAVHAISTGYAGVLGALLRHRRGVPFLLSEHGLYTKERRIDLARAEWLEGRGEVAGEAAGLGPLRELWIRFFSGLGRVAYASADEIISLFEGNLRRQVADGAPAERTRVVPNGVALGRFSPLRSARPAQVPPVIGLLGRVVPIKDVRTFIRTLRLVCEHLPGAEGWIIGPEEEDPAYARECRGLVETLGLEGRVKFLGFQRPEAVLPRLGLLMLTSISEALPLVLLEGFASGVPAVATDVGACRELIEGRGAEDRALGAAGAVVPIADPAATARAALQLLGEPGRWGAAQEAGIARVERYYDERQMAGSYRELYQRALGGGVRWQALASS